MSRVRAPLPPLVEWKDGVRVVGTPVWCDARHAQQMCFVSSAAAALERPHGQVVATSPTLGLLPERVAAQLGSVMASTFGRPFYLGNVRLELFPSGFMPGAASLLVESQTSRVVYAGPVRPDGAMFAEPAQARTADAVVIDATFADVDASEPRDTVRARLVAWLESRPTNRPVWILADAYTTAPELAVWLAPSFPVRVHRRVGGVLKRLRAHGHTVPELRELHGPPAAGDVVLWPCAAPDRRDAPRDTVAMVSGWAAEADALARVGAGVAFPMADRAGAEGIGSYVRGTEARQVFLTGGGARLAERMRADGLDVRLIGPPEQLELFGEPTEP